MTRVDYFRMLGSEAAKIVGGWALVFVAGWALGYLVAAAFL